MVLKICLVMKEYLQSKIDYFKSLLEVCSFMNIYKVRLILTHMILNVYILCYSNVDR